MNARTLPSPWHERLQDRLPHRGRGHRRGRARLGAGPSGPLLAISRDAEGAFAEGLAVRGWDFLFYATFGVVVTSSVELAGVLLVFSFLIVPAICGVLLGRTIGARLTIGWVVGLLTSMAGIIASYVWDLPTGATVVCAFGVSLALCALARWLSLHQPA